ncbi:hypothetical protein ARTHRO9V_210310 [Arthrobacter sp. 9V]|nr:hypothetical protein ARTHRO9V_210310 [Arthrobacter sp. 9V]
MVIMNLSLGRCGRKLAVFLLVLPVGPRGLVLGNRAQLRYPISVGDVSERPKVQHSKCCLV